jgi:hypothetical protein
MAEFHEDVRSGREPDPGLGDALAALTVVANLYARSGHDHRA